MTAHPPSHLSDWSSQRQTVMLNVTVAETFIQPVKLSAQVSLNGQLVAKTKPENMPMLSLHQGVNSFVGADIIPLQAVSFFGGIDQATQRSGMLPAGNYELCVGFINAETGAPLSNTDCKPFTIQITEPPVLISPANGMVFAKKTLVSGEQTILEFNVLQRITINELAKLDTKSLGELKAFDLVSGNNHNIYHIDPKITDKDSAEAMQIPIQMNVTAPNQGGNNFGSRLMEEEGIFYRFRMQDALVSGYSRSNDAHERPTENISFNFSWLPPMPAPAATPVQYKLRIVEVLPGQSSATAFNGAIPMIEKTVSAPFYKVEYLSDEYWKLCSRIHSQATQFAWGVQATDAIGNAVGKNNGWSEVRRFDIADDPDFDLLRITKDSTTQKAGNSTITIFTNVKAEPCPYKYKYKIRSFFTPCVNGHQDLYEEWGIFNCSLLKGHSGPHHGTVTHVFVTYGGRNCDGDGGPTEPAPPKESIIKGSDLAKIPTMAEADKADAGVAVAVAKVPCPYEERTLLRTVAGSWKRGTTTVRHVTYHGTTVAWADVVWTRDIWNVFSVKHCTLEKGHAGPHVLGPAKEEFVKYGTITEKVTYGTGVPQVPPKPHFTDSLPQEDPK